jgi:hydroxymethylglutaryl-CoA lyase
LSLTASEKFLLRNQRRTHAQNVEAVRSIIGMFKHYKVPVNRASIMAAFGCNFEGDMPTAKVLEMIQQLLDLAEEADVKIEVLSLADTMAWATPGSIHRVVAAVRNKYPALELSLHLHDTRGMGIANAYAGLQMGVKIFDAAVAGLGGCPFASHSGAAGNVCTEDLVFMCHEMGIETGIDLEKIIASGLLAEEIVGHPLPGSVMKGGSLTKLRQKIAAEMQK